MNIFIDESGSFAVGASGNSLSLVGALIVPEHKTDQLFSKYQRMRQGLRKHQGEVKGKLLSEPEVARVLELLKRNSCVFEAVAVDVGLESVEGLERHRANQGIALTRHLTPDHYPTFVEEVKALRARVETMPLPLYVQSVATIQLLGNVITLLPAYWSQRCPKETLTYHWVIDGKEVGRVTNAEDWWSTTMLGLMQTRSLTRPMVACDWIDHTDFDAKFQMPVPEYLREHIPDAQNAINLKLLMKESFRFSSDPEPGLELVDIVTNAARRALLGNLGREGWAGVPKLMIHNSEEQYLKLISLPS